MSSVPIVPLFLPQPVPPFPADNASIHSAGSTTDADASSNDDNTATLALADIPDIPAPINDAPADVLLDPFAPDANILVAADAAARDILVSEAVPPVMLFILPILLPPLMLFLLTMLLMLLPM